MKDRNLIFTESFMNKVSNYLNKTAEESQNEDKMEMKSRLMMNLLKFWNGNANNLRGLIPEEIRDPTSYLKFLDHDQTVMTFNNGELKSFKTVFARVALVERSGYYTLVTLSILNNQILHVHKGNIALEDVEQAKSKPHFMLLSNEPNQLPVIEDVIPTDKESPYYYKHV